LANAYRSSADKKKRNIAAETGGELQAGFEGQSLSGKGWKRKQDGSRVARTPAEPSTHRDVLFEPEMHSRVNPQRAQASLGGTNHQIAGDSGRVVQSDYGPTACLKLYFQNVRKRDRLKDGPQFVKAIGILVKNAKIEVNLRKRAQAGSPDRAGHGVLD
jgi:hypothetical protein